MATCAYVLDFTNLIVALHECIQQRLQSPRVKNCCAIGRGDGQGPNGAHKQAPLTLHIAYNWTISSQLPDLQCNSTASRYCRRQYECNMLTRQWN